MAEASTEACRVTGLVTAGKRDMREVWVAAWPRTTNVSREIIWLSRMPAPSKPAASMSWISRVSSDMGAVPGTRRWTRTALISLVAGTALLTERRHALLEVGARPHLITEGLLHRIAGARALRDGGGDLALHRLHGGGAVGGDLLGGGEGPRHQLLRGDHAIDQAHARRLRRLDEAAGEQEVHGVRVADLLGELEGRPAEGIDRPLHLGQPEVKWSIYPFGGATLKLTQQIGHAHAMDLLLTGRLIEAAEAARVGLINRVVAAEELMPWALATAEQIAANSPSAVQAVKRQISSTIAEHARAREAMEQTLGDQVRASAHFKEGVTAFREKRRPSYE